MVPLNFGLFMISSLPRFPHHSLIQTSKICMRTSPRRYALSPLNSQTLYLDISRSPRMLYHVRSLLAHGFKTTPIGYTHTLPLPKNIHIIALQTSARKLNAANKVQFVLFGLWRAFRQVIELFLVLSKCFRYQTVLVQVI